MLVSVDIRRFLFLDSLMFLVPRIGSPPLWIYRTGDFVDLPVLVTKPKLGVLSVHLHPEICNGFDVGPSPFGRNMSLGCQVSEDVPSRLTDLVSCFTVHRLSLLCFHEARLFILSKRCLRNGAFFMIGCCNVAHIVLFKIGSVPVFCIWIVVAQ